MVEVGKEVVAGLCCTPRHPLDEHRPDGAEAGAFAG